MSIGPVHNGELLAPWRQVSATTPSLIYYTRAAPPCLPFRRAPPLTRHELAPAPACRAPVSAPRRVLVIHNPRSGRASASRSRAILRHLTTILREASLTPVVSRTAYPGHATDLVAAHAAAGLRDFAAIVSVGGDGTLHEVLRGVVRAWADADGRVPWDHAPPLAVVPTGSGNAIAASLALDCVQTAALNVVHGLRDGRRGAAMAVLRYCAASAPRGVAVGGVQWGFTADVDQGSEPLRFLGGARFDVTALWGLLRRRVVRGRMRVRVCKGNHEDMVARVNERRKANGRGEMTGFGERIGAEFVVEGGFLMVVAWNCQFVGEGTCLLPEAKLTETGAFDVVVVRDDMPRTQMLKMFTSAHDGSFLYDVDGVTYYKATRLEFESLEGRYLTVDGESVPVEPFILDMAEQTGSIRILDSFSEDAISAAGQP